MKTLFKASSLLKQIPHPDRLDVRCIQFAKLMAIQELAVEEVLLTESQTQPDLFIVLSGLLEAKAKKMNHVYSQFSAFGFTMPLNKLDWVPCTVKTVTPCTLVVVQRRKLERIMSRIASAQENVKLMEFLVRTVPGAKQLGSTGRERMLSYFERLTYKPTEVVLKERELARHAYILYEGDCLQVSGNDPTGKLGPNPQTIGLMSKTTSCYNFGIITAGEWVGEDSILFDRPMSYSVVATSVVRVLRISREKLLEKLTKETLQVLRENVEKKEEWRESRRKTIRKSILDNVYQPDVENAGEATHHTERNFPTACKPAIANLQRLELSKADFNSKVLTATPSRRICSRPRTAQISPKVRPEEFEELGEPDGRLSLKIRPVSAVNFGQSAFSRPQTAVFRNTTSQRTLQSPESPERRYLQSASTLGYLLAPVAPQVQYRRTARVHMQSPTSLTTHNLKEHFGYTQRQAVQATYAEAFYYQRPPSPNPAEQWTRKHNLTLRQVSAPRTNPR